MSGKKIYVTVFSLLALAGLIACDSQPAPDPDQVAIDQVVLNGTGIQVPLPQQLRTISDIDPASVTAVVTVNGVQTELQSSAPGDQFIGQITVPAQSSFTLIIEFYEDFAGRRLNLARAEMPVTTTGANTTLNLQASDYDVNSFDFDGDNVSNIAERQSNTDPLDPTQIPDFIEVEVFAALPVEATAAGYSNYQIEASVGTESVTTAAVNGQLNHRFTVPRQDTLTVNVRLIENVSGQGLVFGTQSRQILNPVDNSQIIFEGTAYNFSSDRDEDGVSDLDELLAGTDLLEAPVSNLISYTVLFEVPPEIANPNSAFATLAINGSDVSLTRAANTYTGTGMAVPGSSIDINVEINDTFNGESVVLATFGGEAQPVAGETLQLEGFTLDLDTDNDGIENYLELAAGSDPFNPPPPQCTPVTETVFATLTDDGYQQNTRLFNNDTLQVAENRRTILIRYSFDESIGEVTAARLNLTVTTDEGDGLLSVFSVSDFEWNDQVNSVTLPVLGAPVASQENDWEAGEEYAFDLNPDAITGDFTLFITQTGGNDVAFGSSDTVVPPSLSLFVERCE